MDAYAIGFVGVILFMLMIGIGALVFASMEGTEEKPDPYSSVRRIDTNTIETVNTGGETQRWQRS